jgi:transcriptional regulator with XRE-family HTH domain
MVHRPSYVAFQETEMQITTTQPELLVPPKRLGNLLAKARVANGYSLEEASRALGGSWSPMALLEAETGRRPLQDPEVKELTSLYDIPTSTLIPARSRLTIDITEGTLAIGGETVQLEHSDAERREVLSRYLSMVYAMRDVTPGKTVPLRLPDLDVLQGVFHTGRRDLEDELRELMVDPSGSVSFRTSRLRGRLLVPLAGVLVAATTVGTLLLVSNDSSASPAQPAAGDAVAVEIGDAVVQERLPDGTPGPVLPRR